MGNYTSALLLLARLMLACLYMISGVPKLLSFTGTIDKMASLGLIFPAITAAIVVLVEIVGAYSALFDHGLASKFDQRFASIRSTG
ncbi:DoxX family membrane protein, partial [Escherichia coli]|uniref:DoxX family membrane protein n=1 Tax=Escherichia coli TaxID=562 RepID=UPI0021C9F362